MELSHIVLGAVSMVENAILWLNLDFHTSLNIYHRVRVTLPKLLLDHPDISHN